jgi:hypothetical protein
MAPILTAEDVVRRIATECAHLDERGAVGIRLNRQLDRRLPTALSAPGRFSAARQAHDNACGRADEQQQARR